MKSNVLQLQIGKKGYTEEFAKQVQHEFEERTRIRINILKSATRNNEEAKEIADKLMAFLGPHYTSRLIGYVLTVHKWRKLPKF